MNLSGFFETAYDYFSRRRPLLFGATAILLVLSIACFGRIHLQENIEAMLPDRGSRVSADFRLLQQAPFARKLVITLRSETAENAEALVAAADGLASALDPQLFSQVVTGPGSQLQSGLVPLMLEALPSLLNEADMTALERDLQGEGVALRLQESYRHLLAPEGWAMKGLIRKDPLSLYTHALAKLRYLNIIPEARLIAGHFVTADGKHALLVAETAIPITDSVGARALKDGFDAAVAKVVPPGIEAGMLSGHLYTLANAEAIQGDLWRIIGCSTLAMVALFLCFLRSFRAVYVFLVPVAVLCFAAVAVSLCYPSVSAVTIGFGGVLLGICVDFGLHVYFALCRGGDRPAAILGEVARPVLFGGLTTIAAFAVLLFSDLPGQRQLAVFSMAGLGAALLLSLLVLPQLIPVAPVDTTLQESMRAGCGSGRRRTLVIGGWVLVMMLCLWQASHLRFNGDLRRMSLTPPELLTAEHNLRETWGDFRGQAMLWAEGENLEQALQVNDRLFALLSQREDLKPVSLAPLLPSQEIQEANRRRWQAFWQGEEGHAALARLGIEAKVLGFSPNAFEPFSQSLAAEPRVLTLDEFEKAGMGTLVDSLISHEDGKVRVLTLAADSPELAAMLKTVPGLPVRLVSQGNFRQQISQAIGRDFIRFILSASAVVLVLLGLLFRHPGKVLAAATPVVTGLLVMFGLTGALGLEFNLFNVVASVLVIGLGVDYGIFMVCKVTEGLNRATDKAVLVSGLTTLAGFGALVLARHPALHSIGITVLLGVGAAIPAALLVVPAFFRGERR